LPVLDVTLVTVGAVVSITIAFELPIDPEAPGVANVSIAFTNPVAVSLSVAVPVNANESVAL
jgi:hypothetical protein